MTDQAVHRELGLLLIRLAVLLRVLYSHIDEVCVLRLVGGGEKKRRVGRSILYGMRGQIRYLYASKYVSLLAACRRRSLFDASVCIILRSGAILTLEVTGVRDDDGAGLLKVVEGGGHGGGRW